MAIVSNSTLIRIFLNSDVEVKKLKKKRYLIKVTLDNGIIIQLNDVPVEVNSEFIDFKLNNSNQMIAKQLVDTANAVLIKTPSITIKTDETNTNKEPIMENIINKIKEAISSNEDLLKYYTSEEISLDAAAEGLILPLNITLNHISDEESKELLINKFLEELKNPSSETKENLESVLKAKEVFEEKLAKIPEALEINHQGTEQLKASCEKFSQEVEEVISGEQFKDEKSSLNNKEETGELAKENKPFSNKVEESTLYTAAKIAGKVVGVTALGVVGYLSYNFIKSKLTS